MRILVINRVDDPACANAIKMIPGAEVRVESESNHNACREAFNEFRPHIVVSSDPTDSHGINCLYCEDKGLRIWLPWSVSMRELPYCWFRAMGFNSGTDHHFIGITDLNELAIRVVEKCVPEVSLLVTDPDESWQKHLKKDLSEIPGVIVSAYDGFAHLGDAVRNLAPDIVVMNRMDTFPSNFIRRYAKDPVGLKIAVFSYISERDIIRQRPDVDFILCKASPVGALTLVVESWTKQIQLRKRHELREGLLRSQMQASRSR